MVYHIILADILLIARIFPRPCWARKNTTQLAKYPRVLYVKPSNKMYIFNNMVPCVCSGLSRMHDETLLKNTVKTTCSLQTRVTLEKNTANTSHLKGHIHPKCIALRARQI